jgi:peptidoglycan/xylan/chitin deacetylase (PgdA/CDA1 family)
MENEFEWIHEKGYVIKRLSKERALALYNGHEIASHTLTHPYMQDKTENEILYEMKEDKKKLETLWGSEVKGFALPFDYYSDLIEVCAKKSGFEYARISEESLSFKPQTDYYRWKATVFHLNPELDNLVEKFLVTKEELAVLQIAGHSYDLDTENMWDKMENIFDKIASDEDILPMTTIEIVEYLKAMSVVEITGSEIINNSNEELWFLVEGNIVCLGPKTSFRR